MRILVTGALGHIGSRLIRELPAGIPGAELVLADNLSTQRYCSLFGLPGDGRYRFIEADILTADLRPLVKGVDAVVHLAAITDAASSFEHRDRVEEVNYVGTERVARACADAGCGLFFVSTTSVYGTQSSLVDEGCPEEELKPQSPYAESKLKSERMLGELAKSRDLRFVTCRFGTIFGISPGMRFHTAINKFAWQACMGVPITVWRTALDQKRPYLDLEDAVRAIRFVLERSLFNREVYNVVTVNTSVSAIVEIIRSEIPDAEVRFVDSPIMNQLSYEVSGRKFEAEGFVRRGDLKQGILATIETLRNARSFLAE